MSQVVVDIDDSRNGMAVLWLDDSFGILRPDGNYEKLAYAISPPTAISSISASPTSWVALGLGDSDRVVIGVNTLNEEKFQEITGNTGSGFGTVVALSDIEKVGNAPGLEGFGVVGAPGAQDAFIISKPAAADWTTGDSLAVLLNKSVALFGDRVAISPNGKTILVSSSDGVEVFRLESSGGTWVFDRTLTTIDGQPNFGDKFSISDAYAVVASERKLNFYAIKQDNGVREVDVQTVTVGVDATILDVVITSAGDDRTVAFSLVENGGKTSVQMWQAPTLGQPIRSDWVRTNTIVDADLGFTQFLALEAGIFDGPNPPSSLFPVLAVSGLEQSSAKVQLIPLIPHIAPQP